MLFSALAKRVFPKDENPSPVEFFARMPSLLLFFKKEIKKFIDNKI